MSVITIIFVGLLECICRLFFSIEDPYIGKKRIRNPYLPKDMPANAKIINRVKNSQQIIYEMTNNYGMRGPNVSVEKLKKRVCLLGASTVAANLLERENSIQCILENKLGPNFEVINAAATGHTVLDNAAHLLHRLIHLNIDYLFIFTNITDLHNMWQPATSSQKLSKLSTFDLLKMLCSQFHIYRWIHWFAFQSHKSFQIDVKIFDDGIEYIHNLTEDKANIKTRVPHDLKSFEKKITPYSHILKACVGMGQALQIKMFVCLQPTAWTTSMDTTIPLLWNKVGDKWLTGNNMEMILNQRNDIIKQMCSEMSVPCLELKVPKTSKYFYDDIHLTKEGTSCIAQQMYVQLANDSLLSEKETQGQ